ncbi:MAG: 50S ribosomal protein L11 methyltransferase, partial [Clostridia bacterium]|nr:50S ribosomal protein L11 methyltransferase [Clostridia bacterium]
MEYTEVTISTTSQGSEIVSDVLMRLGAAGTQILDRADLPDPSKPTANWELMDQSVIDAMPEDVQVKAWFDEESLKNILGSLREQLSLMKDPALGTLSISMQGVKEEDWSENWKQYYKPFRLGDHMVVKPTWEPWDTQEGDLIIEIDPGMAFGTGTHETTAMCVGLIEKYYQGGTLLDVGTGSGILAIAAARLGAAGIVAVDIDPDAVRVAKENVA